MSGSGDSGHSSDEWRHRRQVGDVEENNHDVEFSTILSSPVQEVVNELGNESVLSIELERQPIKKLLAKTNDGRIAGTITSERMLDIIERIQAGIRYDAEVQSVRCGRVEVKLVPRRCDP